MHCKILFISVIVFIGFLNICEGMSVKGLGVDPRCRCIETESRRIGKHIESVELFPPSSHCKDTEIIATLKGSKKQICLDPNEPWVKKVIEKIIENKAPRMSGSSVNLSPKI